MGIKNLEDFERTWDLVKRNCAGAIRAFSAVEYPLSEPKPILNTPIVKNLVDHTLRSGALCICRVWDKNSRSIDDLVAALSDELLRPKLQPDLLNRLSFFVSFENEGGVFSKIANCHSCSSDRDAYACITNAISDEYMRVREMQARMKLTKFRNGFLGHSTGINVTEENRIHFIDAKEFLLSTLSLVDGLQWLLENNQQFVESYYVASENAVSGWEQNKLVREA